MSQTNKTKLTVTRDTAEAGSTAQRRQYTEQQWSFAAPYIMYLLNSATVYKLSFNLLSGKEP